MIRFEAVCVVLATLILIGCSGSNPATENPIGTDLQKPGAFSLSPSPANRVLWGYWNVSISEDRSTVDVLPDRSTALHLNTVRLLEVAPCTTCLTVSNLQVLPDNILQVDLNLQHPYEGNLKLTGFDVRGIFISKGYYEFPLSERIAPIEGFVYKLLNPDGYTQLFNPTEYPETNPGPPALRYIPGKFAPGGNLTATLNPYVAYETDQPRRMFAPGVISTRTVQIHNITGPLEFGYAVDACWQKVDGAVIDPVEDFPPDANCLEAYQISVNVFGMFGGDIPYPVPVEVEVFDHQGLGTIESVLLESPVIFPGVIALAFSTATGDDSWLFTGEIGNNMVDEQGRHPMLVRVVDTEVDQNLGDIDAWQIVSLVVRSGLNPKPVAIAGADPLSVAVGEEVHFYDDGSYDPGGGDIILYEWDLDYDKTFEMEGAETYHSFDTPGFYPVQFRVTDNADFTDTLDEPLVIEVQ